MTGPPQFCDETNIVTELSSIAMRTPLKDCMLQLGYRSCMTVPLRAEGVLLGGLVFASSHDSEITAEHQQVAEEVSRQLSIGIQQARLREELKRNADELEVRVLERTRELQVALENVKQLQGLVPICAWCKKVRDDQNYWHEVEHYFAAHSEATFTHGMCPACFEKNTHGLPQ